MVHLYYFQPRTFIFIPEPRAAAPTPMFENKTHFFAPALNSEKKKHCLVNNFVVGGLALTTNTFDRWIILLAEQQDLVKQSISLYKTIRLIIAFFFIGHHCILVFRHSWGPSVGPSNSAQGIPGFRPAHTGLEDNLLQPRPSTWSSHSTGFHCFSRCSSWPAQWSERWLPRELGRAESET